MFSVYIYSLLFIYLFFIFLNIDDACYLCVKMVIRPCICLDPLIILLLLTSLSACMFCFLFYCCMPICLIIKCCLWRF